MVGGLILESVGVRIRVSGVRLLEVALAAEPEGCWLTVPFFRVLG